MATEKTNYTRIAKHYAKAQRLIIQHNDTFYFVSDGYTAIKVNESYYAAYFTPISGFYKDLMNNDSIMFDKGEQKHGPDFTRIFEDLHKGTFARTYNGNIKEIADDALCAILEAPGNDPMYVNYKWFTMFREIITSGYYCKDNNVNYPVYGTGRNNTEVLILPVRA